MAEYVPKSCPDARRTSEWSGGRDLHRRATPFWRKVRRRFLADKKEIEKTRPEKAFSFLNWGWARGLSPLGLSSARVFRIWAQNLQPVTLGRKSRKMSQLLPGSIRTRPKPAPHTHVHNETLQKYPAPQTLEAPQSLAPAHPDFYNPNSTQDSRHNTLAHKMGRPTEGGQRGGGGGPQRNGGGGGQGPMTGLELCELGPELSSILDLCIGMRGFLWIPDSGQISTLLLPG